MVNRSVCFLGRCLAIVLLLLVPVSSLSGQVMSGATAPVKIGVGDLPVYFSPYADPQLDLQYAHLFFDPLVRWDDHAQLQKRLVKGWKTIAKDVTRFYLKKNIKFHSGNHLSSDDITWTFSQILKGVSSRRSFAGIKKIVKIDRYSFDVYSSLSQAQILDYFSHFFVLDSLFYKKNAISINKPQGVIHSQDKTLFISGSGPYKIKKYNPALNLDVVANKDYWQASDTIPELNFIKINSANSRTFALLANDLDISESISIQMLNMLDKSPAKSTLELPSANILFFTINERKSAVFKQMEVRKAINLAINKAGMLKHIINGMGRVVAVYSPLNEADEALPVYDIIKAKHILKNVKIPLELTLLVLSNQIDNLEEITTALVNMMKRLGVKLVVTEVQDIEQWNNSFFAYDFTLSMWHSPLMNGDNIYHNLLTNSILSDYFSVLFRQQHIAQESTKKIDFFNHMQQSYQITPLLLQNKIWGTDNRFNLSAIFSVNGIPYWHLLAIKNSADH